MIIYFFSQVKDQLSLKIHGKDSGPNGITSSAEAYIIIHEAHHSPVTCSPGPKIASPIILNSRESNRNDSIPQAPRPLPVVTTTAKPETKDKTMTIEEQK